MRRLNLDGLAYIDLIADPPLTAPLLFATRSQGDPAAARAVGAQSVLVLTGYGLGEWEYRRDAFPVTPDHVAEDLLDAVDWVIGSRRS